VTTPDNPTEDIKNIKPVLFGVTADQAASFDPDAEGSFVEVLERRVFERLGGDGREG
jgi:hypothetical protein